MAADQTTTHREAPANRAVNGDQAEYGGVTDLTSQAKQAVTQTAQDTVETAKSAGAEIASTVQEQVSDVVGQAVSQTADTVAQVKEQASSVFVDQRDRAIAGLSGLADALRETGRTLSQQADGNEDGDRSPAMAIAPLIDEIADRLANSSDFLKDKDVRQLIDDAENLARKQPMLFVGALFGVGVIGARLLKGTLGSAGDDAPQTGQESQESGWNAGTGWATPQYEESQPRSDATLFDSNVATDLSGGAGTQTYETVSNSARAAVFGSGASNLTENPS